VVSCASPNPALWHVACQASALRACFSQPLVCLCWFGLVRGALCRFQRNYHSPGLVFPGVQGPETACPDRAVLVLMAASPPAKRARTARSNGARTAQVVAAVGGDHPHTTGASPQVGNHTGGGSPQHDVKSETADLGHTAVTPQRSSEQTAAMVAAHLQSDVDSPADGSAFSELPPGPASLNDIIFGWPMYGVTALLDHGAAWGAALKPLMQASCARVMLTTSYSGMGCAEMAASMISEALAGQGIETRFVPWSATDVDRTCREMLMEHEPGSRPEHVFGNILERIPADLLKSLEQKRMRMLAVLEGRMTEATAKGTSKDVLVRYRREQVQRLGAKFVAGVTTALQDLDASCYQSCWCYRHSQMCCPVADATQQGPRGLRLEVAGTTCVAWSSMGASLGWLDSSSLPCLVWCHQQLATLPDLILHENVATFDEQVLRDILGSKYHINALICTPLDFGIPAQRKRKYTLCRLKSVTVEHPLATSMGASPQAFPYSRASLAKLFGRRVLLDGDVFLAAPAELLNEDTRRLAAARGRLVPGFVAAQVTNRELLPPGQLVRLEGYESLAAAKDTEADVAAGEVVVSSPSTSAETVLQLSVAPRRAQIVNLMQNPHHFQTIQNLAPALLRGSVLYSMSAQRRFLPEEHFLIQGIPVMELLPVGPKNVYPFLKPLQELTSSAALRRLTGNAMHLSQVGLAMLLALAGFSETRCAEAKPAVLVKSPQASVENPQATPAASVENSQAKLAPLVDDLQAKLAREFAFISSRPEPNWEELRKTLPEPPYELWAAAEDWEAFCDRQSSNQHQLPASGA